MSEQWEPVEGWGMSSRSYSRVARPRSVEELKQAFARAADEGLSVGLRGAGRSYGDASQNDGGVVLDLSGWDDVLAFDGDTGRVVVRPGLTIRGLWTHVLPGGWWPKVVSGTMTTSLGGVTAMNIHGKNAFKVGTIGNAVQRFELVTPSGEQLSCSRKENADVFHAAIGGFGMLGVMTEIELKSQAVGSGRVMEYPYSEGNFEALFARFQELVDSGVDYCVGWVDAFAGGRSLGRGQIHTARYLPAEEDPAGVALSRPEDQELPAYILGVMPKSQVWRFARPFGNRYGMRLVNLAKFLAGELMPGAHKPWLATHAGFHFLLDYVPNWKKIHGPGGLIQFQPFVPDGAAQEVFPKLLRMQQERGLVNWLTVLKRHQPDPFLLTHGLDGWSLAMDFNITDRNRGQVWALCRDMADVVLDAGGRFYPAKDSTLTARQFQRSLGQESISAFRQLKQRLDPENLLQTNLSRRLMAEL